MSEEVNVFTCHLDTLNKIRVLAGREEMNMGPFVSATGFAESVWPKKSSPTAPCCVPAPGLGI